MLFLVVLLLLLHSLNGYQRLSGYRKVMHAPHKLNMVAEVDGSSREDMNSILKTEIKEIVTSFLAQIIEKNADIMSVVNPLTLGDNAYVLAKNTLYEDVMEELLLNVVDTKQAEAIQRIDAILKGFIQTERKTRSRLKLNYILAGTKCASMYLFTYLLTLLLIRCFI